MDVPERSLGWLWWRQVEAGEQVALPRCPPMPVKDGERKSDWKDVRCGSEFWTGQRLPAEETPREQEDSMPALAHVTLSSSRHGGVNRRLCPLPNYFVTTWVLFLPPRKRSLPPGQPCFYVLYLMSCFQPAHPGCGVDIGNWLSPWRSPTLQANHFPIPNDKIKSISSA